MAKIDKYIKELGGEEWIETSKDQLTKTDWPKPKKLLRLVYEPLNRQLEASYYWLKDHMYYSLPFSEILKVMDTFTASEHSAFFGVAQQRLGLQQDKVSQFLATIGKMVKEMFQLVRELRILDERIGYYKDSYSNSKSAKSAEITLKGNYVDMVEGGAKSPASVYGMAREVQFTTLPDLFFSVHPKKSEDVDSVVEKLEFNRKVKEVLTRKLRSYLAWKENTFKELKVRRTFTLKYLKQHYEIIRMYVNWVKPYLRNIRRLQSESMERSKKREADIVSAFEGSLIETEMLGKLMPEGNKKYFGVLLVHFRYRTRPSMEFQQEGYNRGPFHSGEIRVTMRSYAWTKEQIDDYLKMREEEDLELVGMIDQSVKAAMEALGEDLENYLKEADGQETEEETEKKDEPKFDMLEPFTSLFQGFGELFTTPKSKEEKEKKKLSSHDKFVAKNEQEAAIEYAKTCQWILYKNFKKSHKMVTW